MNRNELYQKSIKAKDNKYEKKKKRRERLYHNRSLKKKSFHKIDGYIKPVVKWCERCKKHRVKHHHYLCEDCWKKKKLEEETK